MADLYRDLHRLDLMINLSCALEGFSPLVHMKDFFGYFTSRFWVNLKHNYKNFTSSEIEDFNRRHPNKFKQLNQGVVPDWTKLLVPIPVGMQKSYGETLQTLLDLLELVYVDTIEHDLDVIHKALEAHSFQHVSIDRCDKTTFESAKNTISGLYSKNGLTHITANRALVSAHNVHHINAQLNSAAKTYYPMILRMDPLLKKLEDQFHKIESDKVRDETLSQLLMTVGYRLSIIAVVMDHVQGIEHGFVQSMTRVFNTY